jgi:hypothetical protein
VCVCVCVCVYFLVLCSHLSVHHSCYLLSSSLPLLTPSFPSPVLPPGPLFGPSALTACLSSCPPSAQTPSTHPLPPKPGPSMPAPSLPPSLPPVSPSPALTWEVRGWGMDDSQCYDAAPQHTATFTHRPRYRTRGNLWPPSSCPALQPPS